jgi:hypothetical protein
MIGTESRDAGAFGAGASIALGAGFDGFVRFRPDAF